MYSQVNNVLGKTFSRQNINTLRIVFAVSNIILTVIYI